MPTEITKNRKFSDYSKDELVDLLNYLTENNTDVDKVVANYLERYQKEKVEHEINSLPVVTSSVTHTSSTHEKIALYKSLFRGRNDVYALRWYNLKSKASGYSPVCKNKWAAGKCNIKNIPCAKCAYKEMVSLNDAVLLYHLIGKDEYSRDVVGLYPLLSDNTCYFLAYDFDDEQWKDDVTELRKICKSYNISCSVEISRSGSGAHLWIFFEERVSAKTARDFGSKLLTLTMKNYHQLSFSSFDRMFPNQDIMPKGGYGNLIALPLQGKSVKNGTTVFVDENFIPYSDQWEYLSSLNKLSSKEFLYIYSKLKREVPDENTDKKINLKIQEISSSEKEIQSEIQLLEGKTLEITLSNQIFIKKKNLPEQITGELKRTSVFQNPEFYKAQKMRISTWNKPRFIDCSEETNDELILPRGCLKEIKKIIIKHNGKFSVTDKTIFGTNIDVKFAGILRNEQENAISALLNESIGILSAPPGFGKTVTASVLIARKSCNTLIIVHTHALLVQWIKSIKKFLNFDAGIVGGGKDKRTGKIDVAIIQSLFEKTESKKVLQVKNFVKDYGMVIVDECHHVSAFTFEKVMKSVTAKYVYGLTATPIRRDGHEKIIFMQCGNILFDATKMQNENPEQEKIKKYFITKFIPSVYFEKTESEQPSIQDLYAKLVQNEKRTEIICNDIKFCVNAGRTPLVLSERVAHIKELAKKLEGSANHIIIITGQNSAKEKQNLFEQLAQIPAEETLIVLATGKYAGEGFDSPRLDSLFITMPISWKGTLAQYCGRVNRVYKDKIDSVIYDYVDFRIPVFERMYHKRLKGFSQLGFLPCADLSSNLQSVSSIENIGKNLLFNGKSFFSVMIQNISVAQKQVFVSSPYISKWEAEQFIKAVEPLILRGVIVCVITKKQNKKSADNIKKKILNELFEKMYKIGIQVKQIDSDIHRCTVIDEKIVWYGSANPLGFSSEDDCMICINNNDIAAELNALWNA